MLIPGEARWDGSAEEIALKPGGPGILVVDDDMRQRIALAEMIEREGWSFYGAETVEEAVAAVGDIEPEVIILDPRAEEGKAANLLVGLRRSGQWTPVILLTEDPAFDEQWALEHGAAGLERKPAGLAALRDRIAELLDGRATDRPL